MSGDGLDRPATISDVAQAYRRFLNREPENGAVIAEHVAGRPGVWTLIERIAGSTEAQRRRIDDAAGTMTRTYDPATVDLGDADERDALLREGIERLARVGRGQSYDRLFRDPRLFDDRSARWNLDLLIELGHEEMARIELLCRRNGLDLPAGGAMTSIGAKATCLADAALAQVARFTAIEIRDADREDARAWLPGRPGAAATVTSLAEFVAAPPPCDLFHCVMTLQHLAPPAMLALLDRAFDVLAPGGVAVFQLPAHLYDYRFDPATYHTRTPAPDESEMHALPQRHVFALLAAHGMTPVEVMPDDRMGPMAFSFTWVAHKRA